MPLNVSILRDAISEMKEGLVNLHDRFRGGAIRCSVSNSGVRDRLYLFSPTWKYDLIAAPAQQLVAADDLGRQQRTQ
jgi:hypothetical protein